MLNQLWLIYTGHVKMPQHFLSFTAFIYKNSTFTNHIYITSLSGLTGQMATSIMIFFR